MPDMKAIVIIGMLLSLFLWMPTAITKAGRIDFIAPMEGEVVQGEISIQAVVRNPVKKGSVDFYFQEHGAKDRYGWVDFEAPFHWGGENQKLDTKMFSDGKSSLVAFYVDGRTGDLVAEQRVNFTIDNGKPELIVKKPEHGQVVTDSVQVSVQAKDTKGVSAPAGIEEVIVYLDGTAKEVLGSEPYRVVIDTCFLTPGLHSLRIIARDSDNLTASKTLMFRVRSAGVEDE